MENKKNEIEKGKQGNGKSVMICAYAALALSVILASLWICKVKGFKVVTLETFVGVIVALLAIIVTVAIIWQIFNVVEIRNRIRDLNKLEEKMNNQEKSLDQVIYRFKHHVGHIMSDTSLEQHNYLSAFYYMIISLENTLQLEVPINVEHALLQMRFAVNHIANRSKIVKGHFDEIIKSDQTIRSLSNYSFIKNSYEPIYSEFISKVQKE